MVKSDVQAEEGTKSYLFFLLTLLKYVVFSSSRKNMHSEMLWFGLSL